MQNTVKCYTKSNKLAFDLKGSTAYRKVHFKNKFWLNKLHSEICLKDLNFDEINQDVSNLITLGPDVYWKLKV